MAWTITVEVAFATQPMAPTPTWTDITQYVLQREGITRAWGKGDEFGDVQPSTISLTLNNRDGRFTRGLASSPYFPNVRNGKRIRVTAVRSSITYRRFDGHVNEWPTVWTSGRATYAEATITATDRFKRFAAVGELRSMVEEEYLLDQAAVAAAYYPLSEDTQAASIGNIAPTVQPAGTIYQVGSGGTLEFGASIVPVVARGLASPLFTPPDANNGKGLLVNLATPVGGVADGTLTLECFFRTQGSTPTLRTMVALETLAGTRQELQLSTLGRLQSLSTGADGTTNLSLASAGTVNDGFTHHAALTLSGNGVSTITGRLYLDGVQVDTGTYSSNNLGTYWRLYVGGRADGQMWTGTLAHAAATDAALAAARILSHANASLTGLAGERTDQRIGRFADYLGIPSGDRTFDVGDSTVGPQETSGKQPLEAMQEVEATEQGVLFIAGDGDLTFHKRSRRYNVTPAITLTGVQIGNDLVFPGDDFGLVNDMTVTRAGGASARSVNQASIDEFGLYRDSLEVPAVSDTAAASIAQWRTNNYGTPRTRVSNVTVNLARLERDAPSQVALLLAADISTKIRLSTLPAQAPASTIDLFVEGGTETFDQRNWRITFNTSPGDASQVWQLGTAGFTELGVSTRLGL